MKKTFALILTAILALAAICATAEGTVPVQTQTDIENNAQYWREVLQGYRNDDSVQQVLCIRYIDGWNALTQFYQKLPEEGNAWTLVFEDNSYVGKSGMGKTKEGDAKTPVGDFGVRSAFGIRSNPGTALNYIQVLDSTYCCGCDQYYNQIIDAIETGHACPDDGKEMFIYSPEYNYGLEITYNNDNVVGLGSALFIHCKGAKPFTGGCVALDEDHMRQVIEMAQPGMRVVMGYN